MEPGPGSERRALRVGTPIALALAAFAVRALPWPAVLASGRVELLETDGYYHLRRIVYALVNFPESLGFDRFLNFPHGARAIWPPFFDSAIAWGLAPFVGTGRGADVAAAERAAVWLPPLLGAAAVAVSFGWMRRHLGSGVALGGAGLLCVLSASSTYARVGVLDHHVAVALLATALLGLGMDWLRAAAEARPLFARAGAMGALFAVLLHVWPGGILHIALLEAGFAAFWLSRPNREEAARFGLALGWLQGVACAALLAAGWPPPGHWGLFASSVLSRFQPLFFACAALVVLGCSAAWSRTSAGPTRVRRAALALGSGLALALAAAIVLPGLADGLADSWTWLARGERFQGSVLESRPLLFAEGRFDMRLAEVRLSRFAFVFPLAWVLLVVREQRGRRRPAFALLSGVALGLAVATALQARFFDSLAAPLAAFFAASFQAVYAPLRARVGRPLAVASLAALALWLWLPVAGTYRGELSNALAALRGQARVHSPEDRYWQALSETARWLRERTPSPGEAYDPAVEPSYGVLGHWQYGHLLQYVAERPAIVGNFGDDVAGDNYERSFEYFRTTEARAVEMLDAWRARYVVIRPVDVAGGDYGPGSMIRRLADANGGALARHRLVHEVRTLHADLERPRSHFRVYERVAGAVIAGAAEPGAVVEAGLDYTSPTGRRGRFRRTTVCGETGRYRLRVPYATRNAPSGIELADGFEVGIEGAVERHVVGIDEAEVQAGATVAGPDLR